MVVVGVRDNCARYFSSIALYQNDAIASRDFANSVRFAVERRDSVLGTNPDDFALWHLAEFDEIEGFFKEQEQYVLLSGRAVLNAVEDGEYDA